MRVYTLVRDPSFIENQILAGEAILVDVGEELLVYAVLSDRQAARDERR